LFAIENSPVSRECGLSKNWARMITLVSPECNRNCKKPLGSVVAIFSGNVRCPFVVVAPGLRRPHGEGRGTRRESAAPAGIRRTSGRWAPIRVRQISACLTLAMPAEAALTLGYFISRFQREEDGYSLFHAFSVKKTGTDPGAGRGPPAGSPRGVEDATGS
jgi:hypothetical protein